MNPSSSMYNGLTLVQRRPPILQETEYDGDQAHKIMINEAIST
jgi:hypothetical protein